MKLLILAFWFVPVLLQMLPEADMLTGNTQTLTKIKTERSKGAKTGLGWGRLPPPSPPPPPPTPKTAPVVCWDHDPHSPRKKNHKRKKQEQTKYLQISCLHESSTQKCTVSILSRALGVCPVMVVIFTSAGSESVAMLSSIQVRKKTKAKRTNLATILTFIGVPVDLWSWGSIHSSSLPRLPPVYVQKDIYMYRYMDLIAPVGCPPAEHSRLESWPRPWMSSGAGDKFILPLWFQHYKAESFFNLFTGVLFSTFFFSVSPSL